VLNLVDLAGSENSLQAASSGSRKIEGGKINQSLLILSQVIHSLSLPVHKRPKHISFRSSKLTRLMQPQLTGNANLAVLCCISAANTNVDETKSTLKFAASAKRITIKPTVNEIVDNKLVLAVLQKQLAETREELKVLRDKVSESEHEEEDEKTEEIENQQLKQDLEDHDASSEAVMGEGVDNPDEFLSQAPKSIYSFDEEPPLTIVYVKKSIPLPTEDLSERSRADSDIIKSKLIEDQLVASETMADCFFQTLKNATIRQAELERLHSDVGTLEDISFLVQQSLILRCMMILCVIFLYNGLVEPFIATLAFMWLAVEVVSC
jgi:hypothetical protein